MNDDIRRGGKRVLIMRAALLAVALLLCIAAQSQQPSPTPIKGGEEKQGKAAESRQHSTTQPNGTDESPVVIKVLPTSRSKEQADHDTYEHYEKPANERLVTYATIALAIITLFLAIFTGALWNATRTLVNDANDTAKWQLRAYLSVGTPSLASIDVPNWAAHLKIKNGGLTPAQNISVRPELLPLDNPPSASKFILDPEGAMGPRFDLGRDGTYTVTVALDSPLTAAQIAAIKAGTMGLYFFGEVAYIDVFKRKQTTKFRLLWEHKTGATHGGWKVCDDGNDES